MVESSELQKSNNKSQIPHAHGWGVKNYKIPITNHKYLAGLVGGLKTFLKFQISAYLRRCDSCNEPAGLEINIGDGVDWIWFVGIFLKELFLQE